MSSGRFWLMVLFLIIGFFIGVWDTVAISRARPADTVSVLFYEWSAAHPILPFFFGVLIGHVVWPIGGRSYAPPVPTP